MNLAPELGLRIYTPSPDAPLDQWRRFLAEMKAFHAEDPRPEFEAAIAEARAAIAQFLETMATRSPASIVSIET